MRCGKSVLALARRLLITTWSMVHVCAHTSKHMHTTHMHAHVYTRRTHAQGHVHHTHTHTHKHTRFPLFFHMPSCSNQPYPNPSTLSAPLPPGTLSCSHQGHPVLL
jgi:ABC-type nickel/cobalt efflux system permease component RcnA